MNINPELVALAEWRLREMEKLAFVPPGQDPSQGDPSQGGPPPGGDPSQGGAPPMDPSQGGAPPMDPSMGGGAPPVPGGGGLTADSIAQIVSQTMQQQQGGMQGGQGPGAAGNKMVKADINTVATDIFQVKKMFQYLFNTMGIPLPPDILDGPNRDPSTGTPMPPGAPGSTSDPNVTAANAQQQPPPGGAQGGGMPPMPGGAGGPAPGGDPSGGATKTSSLYMGSAYSSKPRFDASVISKASALSAIVRKLNQK